MNRFTKTLVLATLFGGAVGVWDAAILFWREAGVRLLNPALEVVQVVLAYGLLAAIFTAGAGLLLRRAKPETLIATGVTAVAGMVGVIWIHSRILQNKPMFGAASLVGNLVLLGGALALWLGLRLLARHKRAIPIAVALILVPAFLPFTRWVQLEDEPTATAAADAPNITVLLLDTQRADRLSCYGYERPDGKKTSPVIDALAARGTRFEWCYSAAPWTRPSIATMFTGLYPTSHGAYEPFRALPDWTVTTAEMMHDRGYRTAGFSANANISAVWGFAQGFEEFWCLDDKELLDIVTWGEAVTRLRRMLTILHETPDNAAVVNEQVQPWIAKVKDGDRPVYTYIQYLDPHFPYEPPEDLINDPAPSLDEFMQGVTAKEENYLPYPFGARPQPSPEKLEDLQQLYDAEIAFMDREIGKLMDQLEVAGLWGGPNDWLIITSDHGEEFFEHLQWGHGQNLYHEVIRVPLIVLGPGVPAGQVIQTPVSLVDLMPTFADLVDGHELMLEGIRTEDQDGNPNGLGFPGKSLVPLWTDGDEEIIREIYAEKLRKPEHLSLRRGDYKLISVQHKDYPDPNEIGLDGKPAPLRYRTLYDLAQDPYETGGYRLPDAEEYPFHPEAADRFVFLPTELNVALDDLMKRMDLHRSSAEKVSFGIAEKPPTRAEIQRMMDLGYIDEEQGAAMLANLGGD